MVVHYSSQTPRSGSSLRHPSQLIAYVSVERTADETNVQNRADEEHEQGIPYQTKRLHGAPPKWLWMSWMPSQYP